jgi:hypothetical protein
VGDVGAVFEFLFIVLLMFSFCGACTFAIFRTAQARNQVSRKTDLPAPLPWAVTPTALAILHRRLRKTVAALRLEVPNPDRDADATLVQELADHVEALAVTVDRELVLARYTRLRDRIRSLPEMNDRVTRIESLAQRVASAQRTFDPTVDSTENWQRRAAETESRLSDLEQAQREVEHLEQQLGV